VVSCALCTISCRASLSVPLRILLYRSTVLVFQYHAAALIGPFLAAVSVLVVQLAQYWIWMAVTAVTVVLRLVVVRIRNKVGPAEGSNLTTFDWFDSVTATCWYWGSGLLRFLPRPVVGSVQSLDWLRFPCSCLIKALHAALRPALYCTIGSLSVQLIEALSIRSYRAAVLSNSRGGVEFCWLYCWMDQLRFSIPVLELQGHGVTAEVSWGSNWW